MLHADQDSEKLQALLRLLMELRERVRIVEALSTVPQMYCLAVVEVVRRKMFMRHYREVSATRHHWKFSVPPDIVITINLHLVLMLLNHSPSSNSFFFFSVSFIYITVTNKSKMINVDDYKDEA